MSADVFSSRSRVEAARPSAPDTLSRLLWLAALWLAAVSFPAADWADHLGLVPLAAFLAGIVGLLLASSRFRGRTAFVLAATYGTFLIGWYLGRTLDPNLSWIERVADLLGRILALLVTVARGEPSRDPLMFVLLMSALFWSVGVYGSWVLFRRNGFWGAVLIPGIALVLNTHYYRAGTEIELYLPAFLLLTLTLALRTELSHRRATWSQYHASVPTDASYHIARAGLLTGAILISVAWLLPGFEAYEKVSEAWSEPTGPMSGVREFLSDLTGGLRYPVTVVSETFGDSLDLGAGVQPPEKAIFLARPDSPVPETVRLYWRARVLDKYQDGRWETTAGDSEAFDPRQGALGLPQYAGRIEREFAITVRVPAFHLLYVPAQPSWVNREAEVRLLPAGNEGLDVMDVTAREFVLEGETYRAVASLSAPRAGALRVSGTNYPAWVRERYLQLPSSLPRAIRELAGTITADALSPYDKAVAVTAWLRANIAYRRVTPAPPTDVDPVEWFLFSSRVGFCDYYASAEVLMLRAVGVPARLAVGYAQGEFDADKNAYYVAAIDSHAWPEVFFPSYGWVEFEPTRSQPALIRPEDESGTLAGGDRPGPGEDQANGGAGLDAGGGTTPGIGNDIEDITLGPEATRPGRSGWWWVLGVLLAGGAAVVVFRSRSLSSPEDEGEVLIRGTIRRMRWWMATPARRTYRSMVRWGHALGVSPGRSATPYEQAEAIGSRLPEVKSQVRLVAEAYAGERYGDRPADGRSVGEAWGRLRWPFARAWVAHRVALAIPRRFSRSLGAVSAAARGRA
jgi:hypothetical protein